ncbi:CPBP family intramembrane glutamic endopeptidase [Inediibacterium massiliense]|uniref:CPBP family intramembrane glutamic endopeptidase n=1 Tax=Inediibacterium massiliense TaxID=1658111 RepID=UPI0006B521C4|nr:CPBP family intramembrane glutamic endopeptidase [Inediibacterium massiliense]
MKKNQFKLISSALDSRFLPNFFVAPILTIIFIIVGQIIGVISYKMLVPYILHEELNFTIFMILSCGFVFMCVFAWVKLVEKRSFSSIGFFKENVISQYLIGFGVGALMFFAVMILLFVSGQAKINLDTTISFGISTISGILIVLPGWMIQGGSEEVVTRGWLMNVLSARYNMAAGLFVSSSLFGVLHLLNNHVSFLAILNIILVGLFFGLYALKTDNIWGACGAHSAWNWVQGNIFGLEVSGNSIPSVSFFQTKLTGIQWITGGAFGPEAGLAATLILLIGIVLVGKSIKKREYYIGNL